MCLLFLVRVFRTQTCIFLIRIIIFVVVFYRIELLLNFRGEEAELADNVFYPLCYEGTVQGQYLMLSYTAYWNLKNSLFFWRLRRPGLDSWPEWEIWTRGPDIRVRPDTQAGKSSLVMKFSYVYTFVAAVLDHVDGKAAPKKTTVHY